MKPTLIYPLSDKQAMFNYVWEHFIIEKNPPALAHRCCVYNSATKGCAIGCLLPDTVREKFGPGDVIGIKAAIHTHIHGIDQVFVLDAQTSIFLEHLQGCHDDAALKANFIARMSNNMKELAASYSLIISDLTESLTDQAQHKS